tara:strand:+ start:3761 stop:4321 length:561 start_codon:yes stop_codon:yes gene_type:complete
MWILPNHDSRLEKKDAKSILKGKVFRHSKPMTSRSLAHYLSKRGKFLSSKVGKYQGTVITSSLKKTSSESRKAKDLCFVSLEEWEQFVSFLTLEYQIRRKVNTNIKRVLWGTTSARDYHDAGLKRPLPVRKDGCHRLDLMVRQVMHVENYKGVYNSRWVEAAMGLPVGWTSAKLTKAYQFYEKKKR